jgi:hypothetical protein
MRNFPLFIAVVFMILSLAPNSHGADKKAKKAAKSAAPDNAYWIRMKAGDKTAAIYMNLTEKRPNNGLYALQRWKMFGEGVVATTTMETLSVDDESLSPSWMESRFDSPVRKSSLKAMVVMSGKFQDFELTFRSELPKKPKETKRFPMPSRAIFYTSLPRYVARLPPGLHVVTAIIEDGQEPRLNTKLLRINRMSTKRAFGLKTCERAEIDFNGSEGEMWITPEGSLCELILPTSNMRFELVSAAEAETEIAAARKAAHLTQKKK